MMKKRVLTTAVYLIFLCIFFAACGAEEGGNSEADVWRGIAANQEDLSSITDRTEYYDISLESEEFDTGIRGRTVGVQFFQGELIRLCAKGSDIYLCRKDGSSELLLQNVPSQYTTFGIPQEAFESDKYTLYTFHWYLDREGNCYCYGYINEHNGQYDKIEGSLAKFLSSGELLYEITEMNMIVSSICQTDDGIIYLLLNDQTELGEIGNGSWLLEELDPDTGELKKDSIMELPYTYQVNLGKTGSSPVVTGGIKTGDDFEISIADMEKETLSPILFFNGISYGWHDDLYFQDIRVTEDGGIEILWTRNMGETGGIWERLKMEKVEKIPIVVRGLFWGNDWIANRIADFNLENNTYHVILEDCGSNNDHEDFARLTSVQIGAGKGPDIINGNLMHDYMDGLLEKGALENLTPYMEASGISEEDYFPLTFASWRQGEAIYGIQPLMYVWDERIDEAVLGSRETPDIETLVDALLAWDGGGIYRRGYDSARVLDNFLQGTEKLWGMVDWETGSCDFNTPLFAKMLEAAKQYGDDGRKDSEQSLSGTGGYDTVRYLDGAAEREAKGKVISGALFDDGCHAVSSSGYALAINANSPNKEGAWEFISFLISEKAQSDFHTFYTPPHRGAYELWLQNELMWARGANIPGVSYDTSEEKLTEIRQRIEDARPLPYRTAPILDIILEEAADYFNGSKSAEEISQIINRRVLLFLNERK